jgi:hypothetical protein
MWMKPWWERDRRRCGVEINRAETNTVVNHDFQNGPLSSFAVISSIRAKEEFIAE